MAVRILTVAHDIVVIDQGKVVATGTPDELKAKTGGLVPQVAPADPPRMPEVTGLMAGLIGAEVTTNAEAGLATAPSATRRCSRTCSASSMTGASSSEFTLRKASLDEVFFALTGPRAEDEENGRRELEGSNR